MNHRKYKKEKNSKKKRMYTPDGYIADPPNSKCPYCGKEKKPCSYLNSLSRAWSRQACKIKMKSG